MEVTMRVNSNKMKYVDMETITGQTVNNMKVNGVIIKCMEKELLYGKIKRSTKDNL
jgi:hypothetical protein